MKTENQYKIKPANRRRFLQDSGALFGGLLISSSLPYVHDFTKQPNPVLRIGIIGCGNRGTGLVSLMKDIAGISVRACCDIIPAHLQNAISLVGKDVKMYNDHRKLLEDKSIDAVIIATPLFLHYPMAIDALQAGKHIYLEKSMTYDIPQSLELVKRVRQSNLVFQVGYQYRYYGLYQRIKEIISKKWLGKITHFECQYHRNSDWRVPVADPKMERALNWRMYREYCGGPLSELCAHQIDAVNFFLDSHPLKVTGMGGINYWKDGRDTYDNIRTIYEYPDGVKASFTSVLSNAYNGYTVRILGDKATLEIQRDKAFLYAETFSNATGIVDGVTGATITNATQGKQAEVAYRKKGEDEIEPTVGALLDFVDCINKKKKPASNVETASDSSIAVHMGNMAADTESFQTWKTEYSI